MTRIFLTAQGPTLDAPIDDQFGRCANFIIVNKAKLKIETILNPRAMTSYGAGTLAAHCVVDHEAKIVLTGKMGPKPHNVLNTCGVEIYIGITGIVRQTIDQFKRNKLIKLTIPMVPAHRGKEHRHD